MKRANVKNIDYWAYILGVSCLLIFLVFKNMEVIFALCESAEAELHRFIRGFSVVIVPLYSMFICAVTFTLVSSVFLHRVYPVDGVIPSVMVGIAFIILGIIDGSVWTYTLGTIAGAYAWFYVVKYLSVFLLSVPVIIDSQTWSESTLDFKHDAPAYWVWILNILFVASVLSFPIFFLFCLSLDQPSWAFAILFSSIATSLGLYYLKRKSNLAYVFYSVPVACLLFFFFSSSQSTAPILAIETDTVGRLFMAAVPVVMVGVSCFANWSRMIGESFAE